MALSNSGLVVRYWIDEAASGNGTGTVEDSSGNNYDLTLSYGASSELQYTEDGSGNRGLASSATTGTQRANKAVDNSSDALRDALASVQKFTVEIVALCQDAGFSASVSRLFVVNNRTGGNPVFGFTGIPGGTGVPTADNELQFYFNSTLYRENIAMVDATRYVLHAVVDTTQGSEANRIIVYKDGTNSSATSTNSVTQDTTLSIPSDVDLIAFNRFNGTSWDRSFIGDLYYAAIYSEAFDQTRVTNHYNALTADDDTQQTGGPFNLLLQWKDNPGADAVDDGISMKYTTG